MLYLLHVLYCNDLYLTIYGCTQGFQDAAVQILPYSRLQKLHVVFYSRLNILHVLHVLHSSTFSLFLRPYLRSARVREKYCTILYTALYKTQKTLLYCNVLCLLFNSTAVLQVRQCTRQILHYLYFTIHTLNTLLCCTFLYFL